jgi:cytochrome c oxidase subunit 3
MSVRARHDPYLYRLVATVLLAIVFTVSSFTISDGAFGSCFYFGTNL